MKKIIFVLLLLSACGTTKKIMKNCDPIYDQVNHYVCEE